MSVSEERKDESELRALLCGNFTPSEKDHRLHCLAKIYHEETEAYDQTVCSARNERGVAIPIGGYELRLINQNALKVRRRLLNENPDISPRELHNVISRYPD